MKRNPTDWSSANTRPWSPVGLAGCFKTQLTELREVADNSGRSHPHGWSATGQRRPHLISCLSRLSADSRRMPWLSARPPAPFSVSFQPSSILAPIPSLPSSVCLFSLNNFCLIARRISLCPHVFPGFVPPGLLLILQFSLCYMQAHSIFRHCMGAESVWGTDIICTCIVDICSLI